MSKYCRESGRKYAAEGYVSEMGRSRVTITCPFCEEKFLAYTWSLAGGGKKCTSCGALHVWSGRKAYPVVTP